MHGYPTPGNRERLRSGAPVFCSRAVNKSFDVHLLNIVASSSTATSLRYLLSDFRIHQGLFDVVADGFTGTALWRSRRRIPSLDYDMRRRLFASQRYNGIDVHRASGRNPTGKE